MKTEQAIKEFLTDLENAARSRHTLTNYCSDLKQFAKSLPAGNDEPIDQALTTDRLRHWFTTIAALSTATRARKQASLAAFSDWCYQHDKISSDPMRKIERVKIAPPIPRAAPRRDIDKILAVIPATNLRDRLMFHLVAETGLRASEVLGLHVEDLSLALDDERISVLGKGNKRRTVLLDDRTLVKQLRQYLKETGYRNGPLFRAAKNGNGGGITYQSFQELWQKYREQAGLSISLHQLRHSHATELVNAGVSLTTIRKRLGHSNMQTTLRYAEQSDQTADAELRAFRRKMDAK